MPDSCQRLQIAARAYVDPRTVTRCYQGKPVRSTVAARVCAAARALDIPEPVPLIAS